MSLTLSYIVEPVSFGNIPVERQHLFPVGGLTAKFYGTGDASGGGVYGTALLNPSGDSEHYFILTRILVSAAGVGGDSAVKLTGTDWDDFTGDTILWASDNLSSGYGQSPLGRDFLIRPINIGKSTPGTTGDILATMATNTDTVVYNIQLKLLLFGSRPLVPEGMLPIF